MDAAGIFPVEEISVLSLDRNGPDQLDEGLFLEIGLHQIAVLRQDQKDRLIGSVRERRFKYAIPGQGIGQQS